MARLSPILLFSICAIGIFPTSGHAGFKLQVASSLATSIVEDSPTLAPFQHVRFCLRYASECVANKAESDQIDMDQKNSELLARVNRSVNSAIVPELKSHGSELRDGWTISPVTGDCNDYAVTKRHYLLESGLPAKALRLSVVKTASGIGHLILVVVTTKGELVLDNLTEAIRPWQSTNYHWLKIQSASDSKLWYSIKAPEILVSEADRKLRLTDQ